MYLPVSPLAFAKEPNTFQFRFGTTQPRKTAGAFTLDKSAQCFLEQGTAILNTGETLSPVEKGFIKRDGSMVVPPNGYAPITASCDAIIDTRVKPPWLLL